MLLHTMDGAKNVKVHSLSRPFTSRKSASNNSCMLVSRTTFLTGQKLIHPGGIKGMGVQTHEVGTYLAGSAHKYHTYFV